MSFAFQQYYSKAWHPLPLAPGTKTPPPQGFTGTKPVASYADLHAWSETFPDDANIAVRMPTTVIGIDVDNYGSKCGQDLLAEGERRWGPLPPTYISSARDPQDSGTRFFAVPDGTKLVDRVVFPDADLNVDGIEIIQHTHRYSVVSPSVHPETGTQYRWYAPDGTVAEDIPWATTNDAEFGWRTDLALLPAQWLDGLRKSETISATSTVEATSWLASLMVDGPLAPEYKEVLESVVARINSGASRHDTIRDSMMRLLDIGVASQLPGLQDALAALRAMYFRIKPGADSEHDWINMMGGAVKRIAAKQAFDEQAFGLTSETDEYLEPPAIAPSTTVPPAAEMRDPVTGLSEAEYDEFWASTPVLQAVHDEAYHEVVSPYALLGNVLAQAICATPHWYEIPNVTNAKGSSANLFVAIAGRPGQGKGESARVASQFLDTDDPSFGQMERFATTDVGTGQGMVAAFMKQVPEELDADAPRKGRPKMVWQMRTPPNVLFHSSEMSAYAAHFDMKGSSTATIIKQLFGGEAVNQAYADSEKQRPLPAHAYRACIVSEAQPSAAAVLFNDSTGLPQRFLWLPAHDTYFTVAKAARPPRIQLPLGHEFASRTSGSVILAAPESVLHSITASRIENLRVPLSLGPAQFNEHDNLIRMKVAFALAILAGRVDEITETDWQIAGRIMDIHNNTRAWMIRTLRQSRIDDATEAGKIDAARRDSSTEGQEWMRTKRTARSIARRLSKKNEPLSQAVIRASVTTNQRDYVSVGLRLMLNTGYVKTIGHDSETQRFALTERGRQFDWGAMHSKTGTFPGDWVPESLTFD